MVKNRKNREKQGQTTGFRFSKVFRPSWGEHCLKKVFDLFEKPRNDYAHYSARQLHTTKNHRKSQITRSLSLVFLVFPNNP